MSTDSNRRLPTEARREEIVAAALRLLGERSVDTLTTRDIAAAIGVTQPGLFRHFRTREEIILAVVEHAQVSLGRIAGASLARQDDNAGRLLTLGMALLAHVEANPGLPRLLFLSTGDPGPVRDALAALVTAQGRVVAGLVRAGQEAGELDPAVDADAAAAVLVGTIQGAVLRWDAEGRPAGLPPRFPPLYAVWARALGVGVARAAPKRAEAASPGRRLGFLDLAPILAAGTDPLDTVVRTLHAAPTGGLVVLRAPFRPAPLLALLPGLGHHVRVEPIAAEGWLVWVGVGGAVEVEDLRELEPPEPLERALRVGSALQAGGWWFAHLPRVPRMLLPHLDGRGLAHVEVVLPDGSAVLAMGRP